MNPVSSPLPFAPSQFTVLSFDCYGTLVDWEAGLLQALTPILRRHGTFLDEAQLLQTHARSEAAAQQGPFRPYRKILQATVDALGHRLGFIPSPEERDALAASLPDWPPFPDTTDALRRLHRHFRLAVISNIDDDLFTGTARRLGVTFDAVVTAQQVRSYKPARGHWDALLKRLQVPREQVLHVAQSRFHDIAPADRLGFRTLWVDRPGRTAGPGAVPPASVRPDATLPDLASLAAWAESPP